MIALVALAAIAAPIYSSVFMHPETGDMLGMEVRLHDGVRPTIDFALCEGACSGANGIPIVRRSGGFDFVYREKLVDQHRQPVPDAVLHFVAHFRGRRLMVRQVGEKPEMLRLRHRAWGLNLTNGPKPSVP